MKNKFGFILVKPQLGENIGACARSMKNFGFKKLNIVSPKFVFPNHKAKTTSVGAYDIIRTTKVFDNTYDAISEFDIIISLSARRRDIKKKEELEYWIYVWPRSFRFIKSGYFIIKLYFTNPYFKKI